jgi:hypothetical protein
MPYEILPPTDQPQPSGGRYEILPPAGPTKEDVQGAMLRRMLPTPFGIGSDAMFGAVEPLMKAVQALAHLGGNDTAPAKAVDSAVNGAKSAYDSAYQPEAFPGTGLARGIGQGVVTAPLAVARGGAVLGGAANGGIAGLLEPVYGDTSNFWTDTAKAGGKGAAVGAGLGAAGKVVGKVIAGADVSPEVQTLKDAGVRMTAGQNAQGFAKSIEDKLTSLPIIGDLIQKRRFEGITDFNKAVYSRAVQPFGDEGAAVVKQADVGNKGIAAVGDYLSSKYESALAASAPAPMKDAMGSLQSLREMLPASTQAEFDRIVGQEVLQKVTPAGTLTPSVAKQADSALGQQARAMMGDQRYEVRELAGALREAQSTLRETFAAANPATAPLIRAADQGWATLVQMERAGSMVGAKDGIFTPSQLLSAIKRGDTSIRDRRFARGEMLNQDLAQAGDAVLPNKVADSGTVGRAIVNTAAAGGIGHAATMLDPHTIAGIAAGSLPYLPVIGPAMTSLAMLARPQAMKGAGDLLEKLAPYLGLLSGPSLSQQAP